MDLLDLVTPSRCAGCGLRDVATPPICVRCRAAFTGPPCRVGLGVPTVALDVWAAGVYAGPMRGAILAYKERGRRELVGPPRRRSGAPARRVGGTTCSGSGGRPARLPASGRRPGCAGWACRSSWSTTCGPRGRLSPRRFARCTRRAVRWGSRRCWRPPADGRIPMDSRDGDIADRRRGVRGHMLGFVRGEGVGECRAVTLSR